MAKRTEVAGNVQMTLNMREGTSGSQLQREREREQVNERKRERELILLFHG